MSWYLVHTKPRQELRAQANLQDQGFECWLPQWRAQRVLQRKLTTVEEPLFPRYLFIRVAEGVNWSPVKSTPGVTTIVRFGGVPGRVPPHVIDALREEEASRLAAPVAPRFVQGQPVCITAGPFAGVKAVFDMADGEARALVLIELLSKPARLPVPVDCLRADAQEVQAAPAPLKVLAAEAAVRSAALRPVARWVPQA